MNVHRYLPPDQRFTHPIAQPLAQPKCLMCMYVSLMCVCVCVCVRCVFRSVYRGLGSSACLKRETLDVCVTCLTAAQKPQGQG